jgi:2-hydroxychromene-2-carboxylate isomerase
MTARIDFYLSFRSPYSYLALPQIDRLRAERDVEVRLKVVRPIAVRIPGFFERADPLRTPYMRRDAIRCAEVLGLPYRWPKPDPIMMDELTGKVAGDQPFIHRLCRLGAAAEAEGRALEFAGEAMAMMWSGGVDDWHLGDHLAAAAARAGLDWTALSASVEAEPERWDARLTQNEADQRAAGHWGVPLFVFEGEPFFGQDRIDHLIFRLDQKGVGRRL